jgi:hypothetical protein
MPIALQNDPAAHDGWMECQHEPWSMLFWEDKSEHWLEPMHKDAFQRYFILIHDGQRLAYAVGSSDEYDGDVYDSEGKDSRSVSEMDIPNNDEMTCQTFLFWEPIVEGDYTRQLTNLRDALIPHFNEVVAYFGKKCDARDNMEYEESCEFVANLSKPVPLPIVVAS